MQWNGMEEGVVRCGVKMMDVGSGDTYYAEWDSIYCSFFPPSLDAFPGLKLL